MRNTVSYKPVSNTGVAMYSALRAYSPKQTVISQSSTVSSESIDLTYLRADSMDPMAFKLILTQHLIYNI